MLALEERAAIIRETVEQNAGRGGASFLLAKSPSHVPLARQSRYLCTDAVY